jgi:hypothetical protein
MPEAAIDLSLWRSVLARPGLVIPPCLQIRRSIAAHVKTWNPLRSARQ